MALIEGELGTALGQDAEQDRGEADTHAPATRQIGERLALHRLVEAEPGEDARGPARRRMGIDLDQPGLDDQLPGQLVAAFRQGCLSEYRSIGVVPLHSAPRLRKEVRRVRVLRLPVALVRSR